MPVYAGEGEALFECAGFDDTAKAVSFVTIGKRLVAMKGHTAVAVLQPHRARENASIMHGEAFAEAVVRVAAKSGLQKALAHFRFDAIKVPSIATSRTERQIAAFQAQAGAKMQKMQKEQASCFAMAAAGLAKGKFKGVENALAKGLMTEFARLGVRNPKAIVSAVLTRHGMEYAKQLVLTASKLGNLTEAARKETADMLDLVTEEDMNLSGPDFTTAETEDTLDKDDDGDVDGDDFKEESDFGDDLETEDYAVASLLRPARQHASRVHASYGEPDAAAMAREILSGRRSMFAG
jgi:phosphopantothenoylcysteine synthetase/decarboxylase